MLNTYLQTKDKYIDIIKNKYTDIANNLLINIENPNEKLISLITEIKESPDIFRGFINELNKKVFDEYNSIEIFTKDLTKLIKQIKKNYKKNKKIKLKDYFIISYFLKKYNIHLHLINMKIYYSYFLKYLNENETFNSLNDYIGINIPEYVFDNICKKIKKHI